MISLIPEEVSFEISTTDLLVQYTEKPNVKLEIDVLDLDNYIDKEEHYSLTINFFKVAELKCCSVNFFEAFHEKYEIFKINERQDDFSFWKENGYHPDSGFYQVDNSNWIKEKKRLYDPTDGLGLKHYLIAGYDSFIEILASNYEVDKKVMVQIS